jgi:hypothetical protein
MITFVIMHPSLNNDRKKLARSGEYQLAAFQGHLCELDANYNSTYLSFSDVQQFDLFISAEILFVQQCFAYKGFRVGVYRYR